jgi:hypothetical protein
VALTDRTNGVVDSVKVVLPEAKIALCCIYRESLGTKKMLVEIGTILKEYVKTVIFIKAEPLNLRIFVAVCMEVGSDRRQLLLHTEIHWVSRWMVLTRLI